MLVSPDLGVVAGSVDLVLVMREGAVVEQGPVERVLGAPRHPYTRRFASVPRLETSRASVVAARPPGGGLPGTTCSSKP